MLQKAKGVLHMKWIVDENMCYHNIENIDEIWMQHEVLAYQLLFKIYLKKLTSNPRYLIQTLTLPEKEA